MMVVKLVLFFLISAATITETAPAGSFDYMQLVQSWPPSTCAVEGCSSSSLPEMFTIHGLWPEIIETLKPNMTLYWVSIPPTIPLERSWAHQWNKHGTCTNFSIFEYFDFTLKQYLKYDLVAALEEKNITAGKNYTVKSISAAIKAKTTFVPIVRCKDVATIGQVLFSVSLCYNNATEPLLQDCKDKPYRCDLKRQALMVAKTPVSMYQPGTKDGLWSM